MTTTQQTKLDELNHNYQTAKELYEKTYSDYTIGAANSASGKSVYPDGTPEDDLAKFQNWLLQKKNLVPVYKEAMDNALSDINNYIKQLDSATASDFAKDNPELYSDLVKSEQEQPAKLFAQKSTYWIIGVAVVLVLVIGGIIIYKKVKG